MTRRPPPAAAAAHARAQRKLETFAELESEVADLDDLAEMAAEDEELAAELAVQLAAVEARSVIRKVGALPPTRNSRRVGKGPRYPGVALARM